ncbi:MAG: ATP-binding cassette domain-containing protein [Alteromonadaceae bacterium]|nr:ATP-binding cassette domain-containing protein [Alteromonadaceae bacterium]
MLNSNNNNIIVKNVKHVYNDGTIALEDINLEMGGGLYGLLGSNGAGKSTLMRILCTLLEPTSGEVTVGGHNVINERHEVRKLLGYLPQEFGAWRLHRVEEVLDTLASLSGINDKKVRKQKIKEVLALVGLSEVSSRKVGKLSGGMLRRLGVAQALVHDPKVLILDEPTIGLDPEERLRFRQLITDLSSERTILLSTHIVSDLGSNCSNLVLMDNGIIEFTGSPAELIAQAEGKVLELTLYSSQGGSNEPPESFEIVARQTYQDKNVFRGVSRDENAPEGACIADNVTLEEAYLAFSIDKGRDVTSSEDI